MILLINCYSQCIEDFSLRLDLNHNQVLVIKERAGISTYIAQIMFLIKYLIN